MPTQSTADLFPPKSSGLDLKKSPEKGAAAATAPKKRSLWPLALGAGGLGLLAYFWSSGSGNTNGGGTTNGGGGGDGEPQAGKHEADACAWAVQTKPKEYAGHTAESIGAIGEGGWLTWVALLKAYPKAPTSKLEGAFLAAYNRLKVCVEATMKQGQGNKDPMDILAEEAGCNQAAAERPTSYQGKVRPNNMSDADWWGLVGYWIAYPQGPVQPKGTAYADAYERIRTCVAAKLKNAPPLGDAPPLGGLTAEEKAAADAAIAVKPSEVPTNVVPAPDNVRKLGTSDLVWLRNVAYWRAYRAPESAWIKSGKAPPPVFPAQASNWSARLAVIEAYIAGELKPNAEKTAPGPGPLTADEKSAIEMILFNQDPFYPGNPAPYDKRGAQQYWTEWYTNQAWWWVYREPDNAWVKGGGAQAPWKITDANDPWSVSWNRMNQQVIATMKVVPDAGDVTTAEKANADIILAQKFEQVDPSLVLPYDNKKPPNISLLDWYTDVAFWLTYRADAGDWMKGGHIPGPVINPAVNSWGSAESGGKRWREIRTRIRNYVQKGMP